MQELQLHNLWQISLLIILRANKRRKRWEVIIYLAIGFVFYLLFNTIGLKPVGIVFLVVFALIGYAIGSIKIPETSTGKLGRNYAGDYIDEIIMKYLTFKKSRKIKSKVLLD